MGSEQSKQGQNAQEGHGVWFDYLKEIKQSQPSQIVPFYKVQISYLQKLFRFLDKKNTKSLQLSDMEQISFIQEHPLFERIIFLFEQELKKIKTKKISLQIFLHLLTVFHIQTDIQHKFKFLFRIYDADKDFKINHNDLVATFKILFRQKILYDKILDEDAIKNMASEALLRYGTRGQIKIEQFMELLSHDQVKQVMTFRFNKKN